MIILILAFFFPLHSRADTPATPAIFEQDPLCAETPAQRKSALERAREIHSKFSNFSGVVADQTRWFTAVSDTMKKACDDDAKFAVTLAKQDHPALTGQCKPAGEAALADQAVVDHSEAALRSRPEQRSAFLLGKEKKGGPDSLWSLYQHDYHRVEWDSVDRNDVPLRSACELNWLYPKAFLQKHPPFTGCSDAPPGQTLADWDKKDPGVFAQLMTRFELSAAYNRQRRDKAAETAKASRAAYEACVAQNPGSVDVFAKLKDVKGQGSGKAVSGQSPSRGSDITGIKQDEEKQGK